MVIENEEKLYQVIKAFSDAGFLKDVILIGSSGIFAESLSYVDIYGGNYIEIERYGLRYVI